MRQVRQCNLDYGARMNKLEHLKLYRLVGINNPCRKQRLQAEETTDMRTRQTPFSDERDNLVPYATIAVAIWTVVIVSVMAWMH